MLRNIATTLPNALPSSLVVFVAVAAASLFSSLEVKLSGARVRPFEGFMLLCFVWAIALRGAALWRNVGPLKPALGFFLAAYAIRMVSAVFIESVFAGLVEMIQAVEFTMFALVVGSVCASAPTRKLFLSVFGSTALGIGLIALALALSEGQVAGLKRLDEPKYTYGVVCLLIAVNYVITDRRRWLWGMLLAGIAPLLVLSGERNAWLGIAAALGVLAVIGGIFVKGRLIGILVSVVIGALIFGVSFGLLAQSNDYVARQWTRLIEPLSYLNTWTGGLDYMAAESPSNKARLLQIQNIATIVKEHPWFGLGTDQYYPYASAVAFSTDLNTISTMHGEYWQLLVENGIFAFGLYCTTWIALFLSIVRLSRCIRPELRPALGMATATAVYGAVANMFVGGGAVNFLLLFLPIGLCLGIWKEQSVGRAPALLSKVRGAGNTSPRGIGKPKHYV